MKDKRIEDAAEEYLNSDELGYFQDPCDLDVKDAFVAGAKYALENQWHDVGEELPKEDEHVLLYAEGLYLHCRYRDNNWIIIDGFPCGKTPQGEIIYSSEMVNPNVMEDYWMPIPTLTTCTKNKEI